MSKEATPLFDGLKYPGHGYPERVQENSEPLSPFHRLARGQGLGKKTVMLYDPAVEVAQSAPTTILEMQGFDLDAVPIQVTLAPPLAIPRLPASYNGEALQNQTGEFSNLEVGAGNYPGQTGPIIWPPLSALIRWGVGGARAFAVVDYIGGTKINLGPASFVEVSGVVTPDAINVPGFKGAFVLSAFVGPGNPYGSNAQRTIYVGTLADQAESAIFALPSFARRVSIIGCDEAAGAPALSTGYVRFWQTPAGTHNVGNYFVNGNQPISFPVPNGAQYFSVFSTLGKTAPFSAVFELAL